MNLLTSIYGVCDEVVYSFHIINDSSDQSCLDLTMNEVV